MQTNEIQSWIETLSQEEGEECLARLHGLAIQLDNAMDAIVKRQLPSLQGSLQLQQVSCASLATIRHRSAERRLKGCDPTPANAGSDLSAEIKAATESLLMLNRRYSALLRHSGDTLRLLAGLYRSYLGSVQPGPGIPGKLQTWSCEV